MNADVVKWRTDIPLWQQGLMRESFRWMITERLGKKEFFDRVEEYRSKAKSSSAFYMRLVRAADPERCRLSLRKSYRNNADRRREDARQQRKKLSADPVKKAAHREKVRLRKIHRRKNDVNYMLRCKLRTRIFLAIRGYEKAAGTCELLGASLDIVRKHIESLWKPGMTWSNWTRDGWHVDHIKPCASFDLTDPEQQKQCFNYTNLQPLWWRENLSKGPNEH